MYKRQASALMSDRFNVSEKATVAIAFSVLQDLGLITEKVSSLKIDKNKTRKTEGPRGCTGHSPGYSSEGNIL